MIRVAVAILNFNGEKLLAQFLPSVIKFSPQAEIFVIDNGSNDGSVNLLNNSFPSVHVIRLEDNYGFCGGYNRGLAQINAAYFVLLNSDIEVTENWLAPLVSLLDSEPLIAAVQPKILSYANKETFEYAGAAGGFIDTLGYPFCRGRIFDFAEEDQHQYDDEREIFWATGACLVIRSSTFNMFNGFDEELFAHMEEIDLCWKINRAKGKVFYCGKSTIYHVGAGTLSYENPRKTYLNFRNGLIILLKHFSTTELIIKLPFRIVLDWLAAVRFMINGKARNAASVFRAHFYIAAHLSKQWKKRKVLQSKYPTYSRRNIYRGSVIIDYFIRKKKRINVPV